MPEWDSARLDPDSYLAPGLDLSVFYGDLDTNGHVNNVALGRYFEMGRLDQHRRTGLDKLIFKDGGAQLVARVSIDYLAESHLGSMHVRTRVAKIGRSSVIEEQAAFQNDRCVGLAEVVFVRLQDGKPSPWAEVERKIYEAMVVHPVRG